MKKIILLTVLILLLSSVCLFSAVPCKINYQGRLIKDNVPVDGTKTMKFSIYDSAVGGTQLWTSEDVNVEVHNGLFRYVIGSDGGDLSSIDWTAGETLYLEVQVGTDILTPREPIYAYPYAINSHLLEGATKEYFINTSAEAQTKQGDLNIMGNVGIGTTSPGATLEIDGTTGTHLLKLSVDDRIPFLLMLNQKTDAQKFGYWIDTGGKLILQDATDVRSVMTWDGDGNVGIGTRSPGEKLTVTGTIESTTGGVKFPDGTLQTTAPSAPTIEVINAKANTKYTRNHTGLVLIEAHYSGHRRSGVEPVVSLLVNGTERKRAKGPFTDDWIVLSPTFAYSATMSGSYNFSVNITNLSTESLQFVITKY